MDNDAGEKWYEQFRLHFGRLPDPRMEGKVGHPLIEVVALTVCAVLAGAEGWTDVESFGKNRMPWLRTFLTLPEGIPSHDTVGRVFAALDAKAFSECLVSWVKALVGAPCGQIAVDGKTARRSGGVGKQAVHLVSVFARENGLALAQLETSEKSNEIEAIPRVLEMLDLRGCLVTIDAMGCQEHIARTIRGKGADYLLALKENWPSLSKEVASLFADRSVPRQRAWTGLEKGHGRIEERHCEVIGDVEWIRRAYSGWREVAAVVMIESHRQSGSERSLERRYYLTSRTADAQSYLDWARGHWAIENSLHWILDVAFGEDDCRVRTGNAAANFALVRRMAVNLIRRDKSRKGGMKSKRLQAAWNPDYLEQLLARFAEQ